MMAIQAVRAELNRLVTRSPTGKAQDLPLEDQQMLLSYSFAETELKMAYQMLAVAAESASSLPSYGQLVGRPPQLTQK